MRLLLLVGLVVGCQMPRVNTIGAYVGDCDLEALDNEWKIGEGRVEENPNQGFEVGQYIPNYELVDQNGDTVCGDQFGGLSQVIDFSALWCGPCKELACFARSAADDFGPDFVYTTVISQDNAGEDANIDHINSWASAFDLQGTDHTPVLIDYPGNGFALQAIGDAYEVPLLLVVGPDLQVKHRFAGTTDAELRAAIIDVTGVDAGLEGPSACGDH